MATTSYLDRLLDPLTEAFTPEVAAALLELRADSGLEAHITELRRKAKDGTLTPAEDADYKDFVEAVRPDLNHAGKGSPFPRQAMRLAWTIVCVRLFGASRERL